MRESFQKGVYPVMLTPFTEENRIDEDALGKLTEWYIENGAAGLFAVCQSSEMFFLSLKERMRAARYIKKCAGNRVSVIASGHVQNDQVVFPVSPKRICLTACAGDVDFITFFSDGERKPADQT